MQKEETVPHVPVISIIAGKWSIHYDSLIDSYKISLMLPPNQHFSLSTKMNGIQRR